MGRSNKRPPALKHAAFCETAVLPGESPAEFNKLRKEVFADIKPEGPVEEEIVSDIARLLWRKRNLETYRIAAAARQRHEAIKNEFLSAIPALPEYRMHNSLVTEEMEEEHAAAKQQAIEDADHAARKELGATYVFVEHDIAYDLRLSQQLDVEERLQALIERRLKNLLHVRGVKSLTAALPLPTSSAKLLAQ